MLWKEVLYLYDPHKERVAKRNLTYPMLILRVPRSVHAMQVSCDWSKTTGTRGIHNFKIYIHAPTLLWYRCVHRQLLLYSCQDRLLPSLWLANQHLHCKCKLKGDVSSLDFIFISSRTAIRKLKLIRICMRNNNNAIPLQSAEVEKYRIIVNIFFNWHWP